jgi:hypothetical protein
MGFGKVCYASHNTPGSVASQRDCRRACKGAFESALCKLAGAADAVSCITRKRARSDAEAVGKGIAYEVNLEASTVSTTAIEPPEVSDAGPRTFVRKMLTRRLEPGIEPRRPPVASSFPV